MTRQEFITKTILGAIGVYVGAKALTEPENVYAAAQDNLVPKQEIVTPTPTPTPRPEILRKLVSPTVEYTSSYNSSSFLGSPGYYYRFQAPSVSGYTFVNFENPVVVDVNHPY